MAAALGCPPVALLYRLEGDEVEMLPGVSRSAFHSVQWFSGLCSDDVLEGVTEAEKLKPDASSRTLRVMRDYVAAQESRRTLLNVMGGLRDEPLKRKFEELEQRMSRVDELKAELEKLGVGVPTTTDLGVHNGSNV